jgi:hypothetical protein
MTAKEFWGWFRAHEADVWSVEGRDDDLMDEISAALCSYRSGLGFELSEEENGRRELIVSAMGDRSLFKAVDELIAEAPSSRRWKFTALKPARGFSFVFDGDGIRLEPETMVFDPLGSEERPGVLGLRVYVPTANITPALQEAVRRVVEIGLGERASSEIEYLDAARLTGSSSNYVPLVDLPEYIEWVKKRKH